MRNVNDLGYGICPECKQWGELKRYHPRDQKIPRKQKDKYCAKCIKKIIDKRTPFYELKHQIASHRTSSGEGDYGFKDLLALHKLQGGVCAYCGDSIPYKVSLDHVIPKKFGGRNLLLNMILTCPICNSAKQHFEPIYFIRKKGYLLTERSIQRIKGAYDAHDYECNATCQDCVGKDKACSNPRCKGCNVNPDRFEAKTKVDFLPRNLQTVQACAASPQASGHYAV